MPVPVPGSSSHAQHSGGFQRRHDDDRHPVGKHGCAIGETGPVAAARAPAEVDDGQRAGGTRKRGDQGSALPLSGDAASAPEGRRARATEATARLVGPNDVRRPWDRALNHRNARCRGFGYGARQLTSPLPLRRLVHWRIEDAPATQPVGEVKGARRAAYLIDSRRGSRDADEPKRHQPMRPRASVNGMYSCGVLRACKGAPPRLPTTTPVPPQDWARAARRSASRLSPMTTISSRRASQAAAKKDEIIVASRRSGTGQLNGEGVVGFRI